MKKLLSLVLFLWTFTYCSGQECIKMFDLYQFSMAGSPDGSWNLLDSMDVINAAYIYPPTLFVSPQNMINVLIKGKISIESGTDKDFIGIVFGYKKPTHLSDDNTHNYFLFDWKGRTGISAGYTANEGFRLSYYNGFIAAGEQSKYFWGRANEPPVRKILNEQYGDGLGWDPYIKYNIELLYTSNRIRIKIDDEIIFEREGCFDAGKFGFYCMSQDLTRFEDFTYQNIVDFVPNPVKTCVGDPVNFISFDLDCSAFPNFVESIQWDFGDDQVSTEINPTHTYSNSGTYPVSLIMTTIDGCVDTVNKFMIINPNPFVNLGNDTIVPACFSIFLDAGNPGSNYLWSTGEIIQTIPLEKLGKDTSVWVTVEKYGCTNSDSINIKVEPIQEMLFYPNAFSPNGDGKNDVFVAIGNKENVLHYHQLIFDRWGKVVFETTEPDIAWDGKYGGKPMTSGVYVYKVNYRIESSCATGQDYSKLATITLLK